MSYYYPAGTVMPHSIPNQTEKGMYPAGAAHVIPGGIQYAQQQGVNPAMIRQSQPGAAALGGPLSASLSGYVPSSATYQPGLYAAPGTMYGSYPAGQHALVAQGTAPSAGQLPTNPYAPQSAAVPSRYPSAFTGAHIITTSGMSMAGYPNSGGIYAPSPMCVSSPTAAYQATAQRNPNMYPHSAGVPTLQAPLSYQGVPQSGAHLVGPTPTYPPGHPQYSVNPRPLI